MGEKSGRAIESKTSYVFRRTGCTVLNEVGGGKRKEREGREEDVGRDGKQGRTRESETACSNSVLLLRA